LVLEALPLLSDLGSRLRWVHQTGEAGFGRVSEAHARAATGARGEKVVYDMPETYGISSLISCRAGSSTLAELAAGGRAAIVIPFPQAADNHQEKNARLVSGAGAATLLLQTEASGTVLAGKIREAVEDSRTRGEASRIAGMERAVRAFYRPSAAREIARILV